MCVGIEFGDEEVMRAESKKTQIKREKLKRLMQLVNCGPQFNDITVYKSEGLQNVLHMSNLPQNSAKSVIGPDAALAESTGLLANINEEARTFRLTQEQLQLSGGRQLV